MKFIWIMNNKYENIEAFSFFLLNLLLTSGGGGGVI